MGWVVSGLTESGVGATIPLYFGSSHALLIRGYQLDPATQGFDKAILYRSQNMFSVLDDMLSANPYADAYAFDPTEALEAALEKLNEFENQASVADYISDFGDAATAAKAAWEGVDDVDVDAEAELFAEEADAEYNRELRRLESLGITYDAIDSSAFIMAISVLNASRLRAVLSYRARLRLDRQTRKDSFVAANIATMMQVQGRNLDFMRSILVAQAEHNYKAIQFWDAQYKQDQIYDEGEQRWGMESLKEGASIVAAGVGAPVIPKTPSPLQNAVSSFLSVGSQSALSIGNATGNVGLAIAGGVVLGGLGALGSIIPALSR
jgi:hypothetical protein